MNFLNLLAELTVLVQRAGNDIMQEKIKKLIVQTLKKLDLKEVDFVVEHPESFDNGDYSTNVVLVCAKKVGMNSKELAEKIVVELRVRQDLTQIKKIEVAGPGFINFYLSREFFADSIKEILGQKENFGKNNLLSGKKVMVEYTQPNPFKPFHIGHLMSNAIGESISRIFEFSGAKTIRANYQGDVGLHVAKAIWAILKSPEYLKARPLCKDIASEEVSKTAIWIGECYSLGAEKYENNERAKKEIDVINKKVYDRNDKKINEIYDWGRKVTLDAFEEIYKILGTKFDKYYFESQVAKIGEQIVQKNTPKIFIESDGAIIFHAEKYDLKLHTRVFINSQGLPTYDTKELGLTVTKFKKDKIFSKKLDLSVVTTAIEQAEYMKVIQKAIGLIYPKIESKMKHITHGMMRLAHVDAVAGIASSIKMSSRKGNVVTGEALLRDSIGVVLEKVKDREFTDAEKNKISEMVGVSALKYSILRSSLNSDIIYDFEKSISFDGDSGPYLQYTTVRAISILHKAEELQFKITNCILSIEIPVEITNLEKLLYQFPEIIERSYKELAPHFIVTYLTELASAFNTFYGNTKILDDKNKYAEYQLNLVKVFYQTMQNGLWLLGIETPEKM